MNTLEALIGLNLVSDIGSVRLKKLLEYFDNPENIFKAHSEKLMQVSGIGKNIAAKICSFKKEDIDKEFALAEKYKIKILAYNDEAYPKNLKYIPDPPIVLYVKGEIKEEDALAIAIVGSRRASFYGLSLAGRFAGDLAERGFTIVSGMARGIDTSAHRGALKQAGRTIAVIGSGFGHIYPAENKELSEEIAKNGGVVSEFPVAMQPMRQNFPRRNRVISGLSLGVLVVEAAQNSGALITADFALEQGREVFSLPGKIDSRTSFGTNELIKQGAKLVSSIEDITEEFEPVLNAGLRKPSAAKISGSAEYFSQNIDTRGFSQEGNLRESVLKEGLNNKESALYGIISAHPVQLDEIAEKTNLGLPDVSGILLKLQLKRLIKELPGKQFIRY